MSQTYQNKVEIPEVSKEERASEQRSAVLNTLENHADEIDLLELAFLLLDRIHYIIFFVLLGAVVLTSYAVFGLARTYSSTAKLYVVAASSGSVINLTDLNLGTSLTEDYVELLTSYPVLDQVGERLGLDWNTKRLKDAFVVSAQSGKRILNITAVSVDPVLSRDLANAMAEVAVEYLPETMSTAPPNIAQEARLADGSSSPSYRKYMMMGAMLGGVLSSGYFIVMHLMDDTVKTPEDVERYFDELPLASIPYSEALEPTEEKSKNHKHSRRKIFRGGRK